MGWAEWQQTYAKAGLATFPVKPNKRPAVKGYLRLGLRGSRALAARFSDAEAFGFALGPRSAITVLDIDTSDENVLTDALARYGSTPIVVRSGSGNFQAWYRHNGERRWVRPFKHLPIDVLGGGFVVAPPSCVTNGNYAFVAGKLDDLRDLPTMETSEIATIRAAKPSLCMKNSEGDVLPGNRNDFLWRRCMSHAQNCSDFDALLGIAQAEAQNMYPRLSDSEILKTVRSAWGYTERGENWFGMGKRVVVHFDEIDWLMNEAPDAFLLLQYLRRIHGAHTSFHAPNDMRERMPGGGWALRRWQKARAELESRGLIQKKCPPSSYHGPALYRWP